MDSGLYPSFHSSCLHQIIYVTFGLKVFSLSLMKELCAISPGQTPKSHQPIGLGIFAE